MDIVAKAKSIRISARKVRLVTDSIWKLPVESALNVLSVTKKRGATDLEKTLKSAVANAVNNSNLQRDSLFIKSIEITDGPAFKRYHPSTRGRIHPYKKRSTHITIVLTDNKSNVKSQMSKLSEEKTEEMKVQNKEKTKAKEGKVSK